MTVRRWNCSSFADNASATAEADAVDHRIAAFAPRPALGLLFRLAPPMTTVVPWSQQARGTHFNAQPLDGAHVQMRQSGLRPSFKAVSVQALRPLAGDLDSRPGRGCTRRTVGAGSRVRLPGQRMGDYRQPGGRRLLGRDPREGAQVRGRDRNDRACASSTL